MSIEVGKNVDIRLGDFRYTSDSSGVGVLFYDNKKIGWAEYNSKARKYYIYWTRTDENLVEEFNSVEEMIIYASESTEKIDKKIEFTYWLNGSKEDIYYFLSEDERGPELTDEEIEKNDLIYSFYEVEFNCVYENGNIYATHLNGVKLEERVKV